MRWVFDQINTGVGDGITLNELRVALRTSRNSYMWEEMSVPLFQSARGGDESVAPLTFDEFKVINNGFNELSNAERTKDDGTQVPGNYIWNGIFNDILRTRDGGGGGGGGGP